jgi:predicted regulator of Ras-like GTPase activity (Roadblock/LC7/MglB family)
MTATETPAQAVLSQLNDLPGVVGSMVCDREGLVLARAFPPVFEPAAIDEAARTLVDGALAFSLGSEKDDQLDLRFKEVRLLARPFSERWLAVLSSRSTNQQLVVLAMTAAIARLERLAETPEPAAPAPVQVPPLPRPVPVAAEPPAEPAPRGKGRVAAPTSGLEELRRRLAGAEPPKK